MDGKRWRFLPYDESNKPSEKGSFTPSAGLKPNDELPSAGVENRSVRQVPMVPLITITTSKD